MILSTPCAVFPMSPWLVTNRRRVGPAILFGTAQRMGVRFSASPHLDAQKQHIEFGIDPDKKVDMSKEDENNDLDTIIEEARKILKVTF